MAGTPLSPPAASRPETRYVFGLADGDSADTALLGVKGAALAHLTILGLPVPPGFTVGSNAGRALLAAGVLPQGARTEILAHLDALEDLTVRELGTPRGTLLLSVRSGAPVEMPGILETILYVGLNAQTVEALSAEPGGRAAAWRRYAHFLESYARFVRRISVGRVERRIAALGTSPDPETTAHALHELIEAEGGAPVPAAMCDQVLEVVEAVFRSWESPRARAFRRFRGLGEDAGAAATVQAMILDGGPLSARGLAFSRNPVTGRAAPCARVRFRAVGGPYVGDRSRVDPLASLRGRAPGAHTALLTALSRVEADRHDLFELEFAVRDDALWILRSRPAPRTGIAAVRIAVELVVDGQLSIVEAIERITPAQLEAAAAPRALADPTLAEVVESALAVRPALIAADDGLDAGHATGPGASGAELILLGPADATGDPDFITMNSRGRWGGQDAPGPGDDADVRRAIRTLLSWCEERRRVPLLGHRDVATRRVVESAAGMAAAREPVVVDLHDPDAFGPAELTRALDAHEGPSPTLRFSAEWLRAADAVVTGAVHGIIAPPECPSALLLAAALHPS